MADQTDTSPDEEWRDIPGYNGRYQASSQGRIKRVGPRKPITSPLSRPQTPNQEFVYSGHIGKQGYRIVTLKPGGKRLYVHRLVCLTFNGSAPAGKGQVAHYDGDKLNNKPSNLRWASWADNRADDRRLGVDVRGERNGAAKLTVSDVLEIRAEYESAKEKGGLVPRIARERGVARETIEAIIRRRNWKWL